MVGIGTGNVFSDDRVLDAGELRIELQAYMEKFGKSQSEIAKALSVSTSTMSQWLNAKYKGDSETLTRSVARLLGLEAQREGVEAPKFAHTQVAKDVWTLCEYVQKYRSIGVLAGAAGMGKTCSLLAFADQAPEALYLRCLPTFKRPSALLRALCRLLRLDPVGQASSDKLLAEVLGRLMGSNRMLLFDEAQYCSNETLEVIRTIHDVTEIGMVWAGNGDVHRRTKSSQAAFSQIHSRVAIRRAVELGASEGDVLKLVGNQKKAVVSFLRVRSREPGGIRSMMQLWTLAREIALSTGAVEVEMTHVKEAFSTLRPETKRAA
jgi:DNA transposition AAA+ family ATPase